MKQTVTRLTITKYRFMHPGHEEDNMHERRFEWVVEIESELQGLGRENRTISFERVAQIINELDGITALNYNDPLFSEAVVEREYGGDIEDAVDPEGDDRDAYDEWAKIESERYGTIWAFPGDPTIEYMAGWLARRVYELRESIEEVTVTCNEAEEFSATVKYPEQ